MLLGIDDRGRAANADDRDDRDGSVLRISVAWPRNGPNLVLTGVVINDDFFFEFQAILSICPILCPWVLFGWGWDLVLKVSKMSTRGSTEAPEATEGTEATQVSRAGDRGRAANATIATKSD